MMRSSGTAILRATRAKTIAAEYWSSGLWLEWNRIGLAALVANDLESFTVAASAASLFGSAETLTSRITAWFTSFRVTQAPLSIIILFSFSKWEGLSTLGASDVQIRH
jgi:hypothetical protein